MSTKPGVFALSKQGTDFVFSNVALFFNHVKIVFPLMLVCLLITQVRNAFYPDIVVFPVSLISLALVSCFALSWLRSTMQGANAGDERNLFNLSGSEWGFVALFCVVFIVYGFLSKGIMMAASAFLPAYGEAITKVGKFGAFLVGMLIYYVFVRVSFVFPSRSVGAKLGRADIMRASKGMVWPVAASWIIFILLFTVLFSVYGIVTAMVASVAAGPAGFDKVTGVAITFILTAPVVLAFLFCMALCMSTLARGYQWGIENNNV